MAGVLRRGSGQDRSESLSSSALESTVGVNFRTKSLWNRRCVFYGRPAPVLYLMIDSKHHPWKTWGSREDRSGRARIEPRASFVGPMPMAEYGSGFHSRCRNPPAMVLACSCGAGRVNLGDSLSVELVEPGREKQRVKQRQCCQHNQHSEVRELRYERTAQAFAGVNQRIHENDFLQDRKVI
jgi:hypothetical protein